MRERNAFLFWVALVSIQQVGFSRRNYYSWEKESALDQVAVESQAGSKAYYSKTKHSNTDEKEIQGKDSSADKAKDKDKLEEGKDESFGYLVQEEPFPLKKSKSSPLKKYDGEKRSLAKRNDTARLFDFGLYNKEVLIGLQFTIPFLAIPLDSLFLSNVAASLGQWFRPSVSGLILVGIVTIGAIIIVPLAIKYFTGISTGYNPLSSIYNFGSSLFGRSSQVGEEEVGILSRIDDALSKYNIDMTTCMQRAVCQKISDVSNGETDSLGLIINGLSRSSFVTSYVNGTSLQKAMELGQSGESCERAFSSKKCPFTKANIYRGITSLMTSDI